LPIAGLSYSLRHIGHTHTKNGFFKLVEVLPLESCAGRVNPRGLNLVRGRGGIKNYLCGLLNVDSMHVKAT